ncbi:MAG: hypothetical protein KIT35_22535 [Piscinibacter sp.]|uniref:hypothetical protein n=1 Tax=Piscinibacter TaxID=1114981 RepID=UPI000FDEDA69|nr:MULTISPECIES: hypothetical protein [Piscinibacter]MCW5666619.1 hypothetical protein [Piscinibacter sp.]
MTLKSFIYPTIGSNKAKNLSEIGNIVSDLNTALEKYLRGEGVKDPQGIRLPGMNEAAEAVKAFKAELKGSKDDLAVRAGLNEKGHLALALSGIVPRKGKPVKIDDEIVIRKDFSTLVDEMKNEANAVVNLQKGDATIDRAADRQGQKFGSAPVTPDKADFGGLTTGHVILAAHGSRVEVSGTIIGTKLGKRTPAQIVELLTENSDKKKNLSKDFSGTVWLSGCFTAAGGIAPPDENYDYESYARSVWELLKKKGYAKASVKGQPGVARTDAAGDKSSVTPTGQKDYDKLKKELAKLTTDIDAAAKALDLLDKAHKAKGTKLADDPKVAALSKKIADMMGEANRIEAEKESHVLKGLVATYGLKVR